MESDRRAARDAATTLVAGLVVAGLVAVLVTRQYAASRFDVVLACGLGALPSLLAAALVARRASRTTTVADRVTLSRAVLGCGCASIGALVLLGDVPSRTWLLFWLALPTLLLDAVDGAVARRTGTATYDGARLDMEVDAAVLLVLSLALAADLGAWVALIGAMRYLLLAATGVRPELATTLPRSRFRVVVAGLQAVAVGVAIAPVLSDEVVRGVLGVAVVLLLMSFGSEIAVKERMARDVSSRRSPAA